MKYAVKIVETLSRTVVVEADSFRDALTAVDAAYFNEKIVLDAEDFEGTDFISSETFGEEPINEEDDRLQYFSTLDSDEETEHFYE